MYTAISDSASAAARSNHPPEGLETTEHALKTAPRSPRHLPKR